MRSGSRVESPLPAPETLFDYMYSHPIGARGD